jgi:hypothetical protein
MVQPARHVDTELGEQAADHVDQLRTLPDQIIFEPASVAS